MPDHTLTNPIHAITFDWGDTLAVNYGMPYDFVHTQALQQLGSALTALGGRCPPAWHQQCRDALQVQWRGSVDPATNPEHQEFDYDGLISDWLEKAEVDRRDPQVQTALQQYGQTITDTVVAYDRVATTLAWLKAAGFRIGILSHVPWPGWACRDWHRRRGWHEFIDFYSLSSEVGVIKPNPLHYRHAQELAGCEPTQILHVGDHPDRDIIGGKAFGLQTVLKVTQGIYSERQLASCDPHCRIAHIDELPAILQAMAATT